MHIRVSVLQILDKGITSFGRACTISDNKRLTKYTFGSGAAAEIKEVALYPRGNERKKGMHSGRKKRGALPRFSAHFQSVSDAHIPTINRKSRTRPEVAN